MAVHLESTIKRFIGTSGDVKPGVPADRDESIPAGSSFLEVDTGRIYRWDGLGWVVAAPLDEQTSWLALIAQQLAVLQRQLALAFDLDSDIVMPD